MIFLIIGLAIALLCGTAARIGALRKNRSGFWAYATFAFPPFLLILATLPKRGNPYLPPSAAEEAAKPKLVLCPVCGGSMSSTAPTCPHCGNKNALQKENASLLEWLGILFSAAYIGLFSYVIYQQGLESYIRGDEFPPCDSRQAKADAESTFSTIPLFHLTGVTIISWSSIRSIHNGKDYLSCRANVLLSNGNRSGIEYKYSKEGDQLIINVNLAE